VTPHSRSRRRPGQSPLISRDATSGPELTERRKRKAPAPEGTGAVLESPTGARRSAPRPSSGSADRRRMHAA
jgi:hypothetical protein